MAHPEKAITPLQSNTIINDGSRLNRVQFPEGLKLSSPGIQSTVPFERGEETPLVALRQDSEHGYASSTNTDDGEDSSEYDWSTEEDLVDEAAKFESQMGHRQGWSLKRFVYTFPL